MNVHFDGGMVGEGAGIDGWRDGGRMDGRVRWGNGRMNNWGDGCNGAAMDG